MGRGYGTATVNSVTGADEVTLRVFAWFTVKNRSTGATETLGLWNGADTTVVTIDTTARTYQGAGNLLGLDPIVTEAGLNVQMQRLTLSGVSPDVDTLFRTYDARLAPVEVHRGRYLPSTGALVETPHRLFLGTVDKINVVEAADGNPSKIEIDIASSTRALTRALTLKYSDETMRQISGATDNLMQYAGLSGEVATRWGG